MSWKVVFFLIFYAKQRRLKRQGKMVGQAVLPGNFKKRYKRSPYDSGVLFYWLTVLTWILFNQPVMSQRVVYRRFFKFWLIFPYRNYKSRYIEYNFSWYWHQKHFIRRRKHSLSSKTCSKHQELQRKSQAFWRYRWLACVLIALQVARTSFPRFQTSSHYFPPNLGLVPKSPWRNSSTTIPK